MQSNALRKLGRLSSILPLAILTSCASLTNLLGTETDGGVKATMVSCESFVPITVSKQELETLSTETLTQIRAHNTVWVELCRRK